MQDRHSVDDPTEGHDARHDNTDADPNFLPMGHIALLEGKLPIEGDYRHVQAVEDDPQDGQDGREADQADVLCWVAFRLIRNAYPTLISS